MNVWAWSDGNPNECVPHISDSQKHDISVSLIFDRRNLINSSVSPTEHLIRIWIDSIKICILKTSCSQERDGQRDDPTTQEYVDITSRRLVTAYPESIKHECKLIRAKLHVRLTSGSGPAHSHVSSRHRLKFKVPFPHLHGVRPLYSEEADLVDAEPLSHLSYSAERIENRVRSLTVNSGPSEPLPTIRKTNNGTIDCN